MPQPAPNRSEDRPRIAVLCDFDGTITPADTGELVLSRFADGDWKVYDRMLEEGKLGLTECIEKQFAMVKAEERQILEFLKPLVEPRPGFQIFVRYCLANGIKFVVVSAGLDFVVMHFLDIWGVPQIEMVCPKAVCRGKAGISLIPPKIEARGADFKEGTVLKFKGAGFKAVYIGEGLSDANAVKSSDYVLAIKDSWLADFLRKIDIPWTQISDFIDALEALTAVRSTD